MDRRAALRGAQGSRRAKRSDLDYCGRRRRKQWSVQRSAREGHGRLLVAYGQNGEAVRPEQGYPLRLMVPGWEGIINVKWLRRIKVGESSS